MKFFGMFVLTIFCAVCVCLAGESSGWAFMGWLALALVAGGVWVVCISFLSARERK